MALTKKALLEALVGQKVYIQGYNDRSDFYIRERYQGDSGYHIIEEVGEDVFLAYLYYSKDRVLTKESGSYHSIAHLTLISRELFK